jgi:exodeoxyribonuclease VII large subunit
MYEKAVAARSPQEKLARIRERIDFLGQSLNVTVDGKIGALRSEYSALVSGLEALSPLAVLGRGYGIVMDGKGRTVADAEKLTEGQRVEILMRDGKATAEIIDKELKTERGQVQ